MELLTGIVIQLKALPRIPIPTSTFHWPGTCSLEGGKETHTQIRSGFSWHSSEYLHLCEVVITCFHYLQSNYVRIRTQSIGHTVLTQYLPIFQFDMCHCISCFFYSTLKQPLILVAYNGWYLHPLITSLLICSAVSCVLPLMSMQPLNFEVFQTTEWRPLAPPFPGDHGSADT